MKLKNQEKVFEVRADALSDMQEQWVYQLVESGDVVLCVTLMYTSSDMTYFEKAVLPASISLW